MIDYDFLDTSSLMIQIPKSNFIISSITLLEIESIKYSSNKDFDTKQRAREVSRYLLDHPDQYQVIIFTKDMLNVFTEDYEINSDLKILSCVLWLKENHQEFNYIFYTNDNNLSHIAKLFLGKDNVKLMEEEPDD